ncbi:uncharacterized protein WCC33_000712 [Rhinophrynus dorsalis]
MAVSSASLPWLENTRSQIQNLQEWKEFTAKIQDAVQQQMNESSVNDFSGLSESEKVFVLQKAAKALHAGDIYKKITARISSCLEDNIYSYVAHELQDSDVTSNHSDLVANHIHNGVVNILDKRPDLKVKLHILFNQPLSVSLRSLTWKLQLTNTKARMEYLSQVSMNKARSVLDREISLQCQELLIKEPTFQHLRDNKSIERTMRNVLSYYHKLQHMKGNLPEAAYLLLVPLVQAVMDNSDPSTTLDSASTLLVEEYITFMDSRPAVMRQPYSLQDSSSDDAVFQEIAQILNKISPNLSRAIQDSYTSLAKIPEESLMLGIVKILQPILQVMFVGYLQMSTLLYVWDQYIIGLDQPTYNCLPAISLTFLLLLQGHLSTCNSHNEMETVIKTHGPTLSVQEFQVVINKYFYSELFSILNEEGSGQFPVHDPTQGTPQWSHLSRTTVPQRTRPQDRRQAREERELLKKQTTERQRKEEEMRHLQEVEQRRQEENRLIRLLEDSKKRFEAQKAHLENQLVQEQQQSYEKQKRAEAQISELQGEIRRLMHQRRTSVGGNSVESLLAPPPSANSQNSTDTQVSNSPATFEQHTVSSNTSAVKEVNGKTAHTVAFDLIKRIMESADLIVNGQSIAEQDELNVVTKKYLKSYKEDVKNAEIELFGHELELNELDRIEEPKKSEISKRLSVAIKRRTEARYSAALKQGERTLSESVTYTNTI